MAIDELRATVIDQGFCIGCGACAAVRPDAMTMQWTGTGFIQARVNRQRPVGIASNTTDAVDPQLVCPFAANATSEDELAAEAFPSVAHRHSAVGRYINCYAGKVTEHSGYDRASSGGIARHILESLFVLGHVDHVVQVYARSAKRDGDPLFFYDIAGSVDAIRGGSKSAYYPVEMSRVLRHVIDNPGRYAITGVPCFIKAVRLACRVNPVLRDRIHFTVGIVCGHLKSRFFAELLAWQLNVPPWELESIDFRVRLPNLPANHKGVRATSRYPTTMPSPALREQELFGTNYGQGFFKYKACDYCDDVMAETADVSIGDAWLPQYIHQGTSLVIVRNEIINCILAEHAAAGRLHLDYLSPDQAADSQAAGLRHRRQGLSYRLRLLERAGRWIPRKRVRPGSLAVSFRYKLIFLLRMSIATTSAKHFGLLSRICG
jgi:coenzyme F420-reducing hydrogenase beta subunit